MTTNKWTTFKVLGDYNIDIRSLYESWATTAGLEKWFLRKADFYTVPLRLREPQEFILKEDTYEWYWHGWDDSTCEKGQILEANGTDFIKFTFSYFVFLSFYHLICFIEKNRICYRMQLQKLCHSRN